MDTRTFDKQHSIKCQCHDCNAHVIFKPVIQVFGRHKTAIHNILCFGSVFAMSAMYFFCTGQHAVCMENNDFTSFWVSMRTLYLVFTGETVNDLMYRTMGMRDQVSVSCIEIEAPPHTDHVCFVIYTPVHT